MLGLLLLLVVGIVGGDDDDDDVSCGDDCCSVFVFDPIGRSYHHQPTCPCLLGLWCGGL